jgi:hypothetical protein
LTAKAIANPRKIHVLVPWPTSWVMSKVPAPRPAAMIATSMRSEPAIVYATNLYVAPSLPGPPQTPIRT